MLFVQILGSGGTIVWVMLLSTVVLRTKYRLMHFAGVVMCLLGIGALAYADIHSGKVHEGNCVCVYIYIMNIRICMCVCIRDVPIIGSVTISADDMLFFTISVIGTACTGSRYKYRL